MEELTIGKLLKKIESYNPTEVNIVRKAYDYADRLHENQIRLSGEPYIIHPLSVAYTLAEMHADRDTVCAALLHDVVEDTPATLDEVANEFNVTIANLVNGVTKLSKTDKTEQELYVANMRKMIMGTANDVRIIIIKLSDRLHNMRTLEFKSPEKQKRISLETLEYFVPLANYLGAYQIKCELEDIALSYLKPDIYKSITEETQKKEEKTQYYINEMLSNIKKLLNNEAIPNELKVQTKNIYGIYKRMQEGQTVNNMHDLFALKIMVDNVVNCYNALRIVHSEYRPINDKFKDYLFNPKYRFYRSIHTSVVAPNETLVQNQIRTFDMDKIATFGVTSWWDINKGEAGNVMLKELSKKHQIISSLTEMDAIFSNNSQFVNEVKHDLFSDEICVYAADGKRVTLPKGSTPIDFAYLIHTEIGNKLLEAYVNGKIVPINYKLNYSDWVVIKTDENAKGPQQDWLEHAYTSLARRKISNYLNKY